MMTDHPVPLVLPLKINQYYWRSVMACIVAGIRSLLQHLKIIGSGAADYDRKDCGYCGKSGLWRHGTRYRKVACDREQNTSGDPIPILRKYCPSCKRTCSLLPECLPPLRWYLWQVQEAALRLAILGVNINKISKKIIPSRWTIRRWLHRFTTQFELHALCLKTRWPTLGYATTLYAFWQSWLEEKELSTAMCFLNAASVVVP